MVAHNGPHGILPTRPGLSTVTSRSSQLKLLPAKLPTNGGAPPGHRGDQLTAGTSGFFLEPTLQLGTAISKWMAA